MNWLRPITPLGWAALVGAVAGYSVGWWLGWIEFVALGVGCLLAALIAIPFVVGGHNLTLERSIDPERVPAGEPAVSVLRVTNVGEAASAPRMVTDLIGGEDEMVDVPSLRPGTTIEHTTPLPTQRRGVIAVGPADITKSDPLGLLRRNFGGTGTSQLWVHPRYRPLAPLKSGFVKDLEGPTHDDSPAGDVAFHAIRDYSPGDDVRHIHWMSTARTGSLMIRHYVDNRRPYLGVLIDDDPESMTADQFELALEVAASQAVSATIDNRPISIWVGAQQVISHAAPADSNTALNRLCVSAQSAQPLKSSEIYEQMRRIDQDISAFVFVTGERSPQELLPLSVGAARHGGVVLARCVDQGTAAASLPNAEVIDFTDLEGFSSHWRGIVR